MEGFAAGAQLEGLAPEMGGYQLVFDDDLFVQVIAPNAAGADTEGEAVSEDSVYLTATLGPLSETLSAEDRALVMHQLLGAGYIPDEPLRIYSIEKDSGQVVLTSMRCLEGIECEEFEDWLNNFVEEAAHVKAQLSELGA